MRRNETESRKYINVHSNEYAKEGAGLDGVTLGKLR